MKRILLALSLLALLAGCNTLRQHEPVPVVDMRVDLDRFMGQWYMIASVPTVLDRKAFNGVQTFQRADRGIDITYEFNAGAADGELKTVNSRAMVDNPGINSDWEVTYAWPIRGDYKILWLEPDYSATAIGHPNRKNVWILSRQRTISPPVYSDIILYLQQLGYDVGNIRRVPQG